MQDVPAVDWVGEELLVFQAVDEELVVQRDKEVLLVPQAGLQDVMVVEGDACCINWLLDFRLELCDWVVRLLQVSYYNTAFSVDGPKQAQGCLLRDSCRDDLLLVVEERLGWSFEVIRRQVPYLDRLVG